MATNTENTAACVYSCTYCYVPSVYRKLLHGVLAGRDHSDVVA